MVLLLDIWRREILYLLLPLLSLFVDVQIWISDQRAVHKWRRSYLHFRQDNWCVAVQIVCPYWYISYPKWHHLVYEQSHSVSACSELISIDLEDGINHQICSQPGATTYIKRQTTIREYLYLRENDVKFGYI